MPRFRFDPTANGLEMILGELERPIMEIVWAKEPVTVADVVAALETDHAYTTIKTVMDRLEKKGLLTRINAGRPVMYEATINAKELKKQASRSMIEGLVKHFGSTAVVEFAAVLRENPKRLKELRSLLEQLPDDP